MSAKFPRGGSKPILSHPSIYRYCIDIVHDRAMAIRVIALNRDVSSMLHCIEIISHSFSILSSVESASIPCMCSFGCYQ